MKTEKIFVKKIEQFFCRPVRLAAILASFGGALTSWSAETDWFRATFADYAPGQELTSAGATGGTWSETGATVTNVFDGVRNGIDVSALAADALSFSPLAAPAAGDVVRIDIGIWVELLAEFEPVDFDGAAALTPACDDDGQPAFFGFTVNGWKRLTADGVTPAAGKWIDGRIELRTAGDLRFVRYLVKTPSAWVALADATGTSWFRTVAPGANAAAVSKVSFQGRGRVSGLSGRTDDGEALRLYRWAGGADGDWNDAANWTVDGVAAASRPSRPGDIAIVDGTASLVNGDEQATVRDLTVGFAPDGTPQWMGGALTTSLTFDLSRPRVGVPLKPTPATFLGLTPDYAFFWRRGTTAKSYESGFICEKAAYTPTEDDYEHWFTVTVCSDGAAILTKEFFFSRLPVLYLTTDDGATPSVQKEPHDGRLFVQGNETWGSLYDGKMEIKVRGNSTKGYPKKPWKVKLDKKTAMFGIPKNKHWVLLANYNDQTMLRNKFAYDFANAIGSLGMRSTWVECILNGQWQGTYQFCEHIRVDENRIDVHDWEGDAGDLAEAFAEKYGLTGDQEDALAEQLEKNFSWVTADSFSFTVDGRMLTGKPSELLGKDYTGDISGGYVFEFSDEYDEISKFTTSAGGTLTVKTMFKSPEYLKTNAQMMDYCQKFMQAYWNACTSVDGYANDPFTDVAKPLHDYCDIDSMVNYWLVMEMFGNNDATYKSRYAYKAHGEKLVFGPVWDFDWGVGSARVTLQPERWTCQTSAAAFYKEWADDPDFCTRLHTRYWQVRETFAKVIGEDLVAATNFLYAACRANSAKWDWYYKAGAAGFDKDVARLKGYLDTRLKWLDRQFASVPVLMESVKTSSGTAVNSAQTYTADARVLPLAFEGLTRGGVLLTGRPLRARFAPGEASVASVSCFVNGRRVIDRRAPVEGVFDALLPARAFTRPVGEPNCVAFIAYDGAGAVIARNFALVPQVHAGTVLLVR
jgi:hypothetical protein